MQMLPVEVEVEGEGEGKGEGEETPVASVELQIYHHLISIWRRAVLMTLLTTLKSSSRGGRTDRQRDSGTDRQRDIQWDGWNRSYPFGCALHFPIAFAAFHHLPFAVCRLSFALTRPDKLCPSWHRTYASWAAPRLAAHLPKCAVCAAGF